MIVPMKKITVVVLESHRDRELSRLKRLGLLHPSIEKRQSEETDEVSSTVDLLRHSLTLLPPDSDLDPVPTPGREDDLIAEAVETASEVIRITEQVRTTEETLTALNRELERLRPLGDYDFADVALIRAAGVDLRVFAMNARDVQKNPPSGATVLTRIGKKTIVAITRLSTESAEDTWSDISGRSEVEAVQLPDRSPAEIRADRNSANELIAEARNRLERAAASRELIESALASCEHRLQHAYVKSGMDDAERISYITGFVPEDEEETIRKTARNNGWGLMVREPDPGEEVPTKIRNRRWVRTIRPIFDMIGVIPGYGERDISTWFLLFFTVFVGMIIGDAGYGAVLFLGAIYAIVSGKRKSGRVSEGVVLLTVLSLATLAWGAMTGNWFGYAPIAEIRPFSYLVIPALNAAHPRSNASVQLVCFVLAVTHLTIAHIWNFIRELGEKPAIKAFAQLGWLGTILGLFFLVSSLFLGWEMPPAALYMIIGGMGFVFLFSGQNPDTGFFGGVAKGLGNAFTIIFDGIGAFSDVISYIRLFAVGLASVAIAQAFNDMAASIGTSPVGYVLAAVILMLGHTLNLVMGGLAVVVHGVRLNLLEFSGHLGMEWTGVAYQPFAEEENT